MNILILKVNICILFVHYVKGCVFHPGYYLANYDSGNPVISSEHGTAEACCDYCLSLLVQDALIYAFLVNAGPYCFCVKYKYPSIGQYALDTHGFYWRPPVNHPVPANPYNWTIGSTYNVQVTYREYKGTNDQMEIYTFNNMSHPTLKSGQIILESIVESHEIPFPAERKFIQNNATKLHSSLKETFKDIPHFVFGHYALTFTVADMGAYDNSELWFTSTYSNDEFAVIDFKSFRLTRPSRNCHGVVLKHDGAAIEGGYVVSLSMNTSDVCNVDLENVHLLLAHEDMLEAYEVKYEDQSIEATSVIYSTREAKITFDRFYMRSIIDIKIYFRFTGTVSRKTAIMSALLYTGFANNISSVKKEEKIFTTLTNLQYGIGFYVLSTDTSKCLNTNPSNDGLVLDLLCSYFRAIPHNLLHESGKCARVTATETILEECNKTRRLEIRESRIHLPDGQQMAHSSTTVDSPIISATPDSTGTTLKRTYDIPNYISKLKGYTPQLRNIIAYDNITDTVFGKDMNGHNVLIKKRHNERKLFYTSPVTWNRLFTASTVVMAKSYSYSDLATAPKSNEIVFGDVTFDVTYYGIIDRTSDEYFILWIPDDKCNQFAGQSQILALRTCIEIKKYCPQVQNGFFYIYGVVDKLTTSKVYCDMETDNGGWVVIANYTVRNGVHGDISNNQTDILNDVATSGFTKYLSSNIGFSNVFTYIGLKQIRFYCYTDKPGRTLHTRSLYTSEMVNAFVWMKGSTSTQYTVCNSFQMYPDDTSHLSRRCSEWGNNGNNAGGGYYGYTGDRSNHLYKYPIHIAFKNLHWFIGFNNINVCDECVEKSNTVTYGDWIIYVR
ncbi:uncharacterized protein LOC130630309 isoform X2 [Hydractinia symbiolongicarpus]|uniref:uncharacterized protein LOC130630309 isoform X2 n=1 Tax=Hydractinia symbiolongicarpus TaxID=13093 RepID=UPI00254E67AE|nr:uncharacterized protein LOC130630309 isoform X2 [Hydractinia symbiolongicarpus]